MRNPLPLLLAALLVGLFPPVTRAVEKVWEYSVQVSSTIQESPARITLNWLQDQNGTPASYTVSRKAAGDSAWGPGTTLPGNVTTYSDTNVTPGTAYEYRVTKAASGYNGYGYVQTGIKAPLVEGRGKLVLVVDNSFTTSLAAELARLEQDLLGDGWTVVRHNVNRTDSPAAVKNLIKAAYSADPANVKSVFLFGHVPVPYSGQFNPDGHPDHVGAWPADAYYGDMDGNWTDSSVNYVQTINSDPVDAARMSNRPGDGKFDQTDLPSAVELEVGRVDLSQLPGRVTWGGPATFASETELLRKYLNKDHNFRHRVTNPPRRAIIADYFGNRGGEAFAASGYRAFAPLVGPANVRNLNVEFNDQKGVWIPQLAQNSALLAYASGAGSYATIAGLGSTGLYNDGSTTELVSNNTRGVFNLLFGSWLGDWDHEDNILRAPLATNDGLVSVWSGRPHWFVHPLGLGSTIGSVTRLSQNNKGLYETQINSAANRVHIALMGDPTLRLHPVAPVGSLNGSASGSSVSLTWSASNDSALVGYHVYRRTSNGSFTRLTSAPVTGTAFTDSASTSGATYMVRAIKLESTPSGSYYNPSQGVFWTVGGGSTPPATTTDPISTTPTTELTTTSPGSTTTTDSSPTTTTTDTTTVTAPATTTTTADGSVIWFDDALPAGAGTSASGGDSWNWVTASPAPFSGTKAHQSNLASGLHEHSFNWASPLVVNTGEVLITHVYLDPANPPSEIMLSWGSASWEHRAYWGSNDINYGTNNTPGRFYMGALPPAGQWVRLAVPASAVALEGAAIQGMSFAAFNGRVTWDNSGKAPATAAPAAPTAPSATLATTVSVIATDANAAIGNADDTAVLTFSRTGSTSAALTVNFNLSGTAVKWIDYRRPEGDMPVTVTIPAGSATATMTIVGIANITNANPATAIVTLATDSAYALSAQKSATVTLGATSVPSTSPQVDPAPTPTTSPSPTPTTASDVAWFDDTLPAGAGTGSTGGDSWNWITANPAPFSGSRAHQSNIASNLHEHFFNFAAPLTIATGEKLYAYVYLDPANVPAEIMLSWCSNNWEHRAYWGADKISSGKKGTASRYYAGPMPVAGQWVRLELPASAVALEGHSVQGMGFGAFGGRVTWDQTGKTAVTTSTSTTPTPAPGTTTPTTSITDFTWVDDAVPAGAGTGVNGGDVWNWVSSSPAPFSGKTAHQSANVAGLHEHFFNWASPLSVGTGEVLFTYVYLDPANLPSTIMLSWGADTWEHRAYWGANKINYGTPNTPGRHYAGPLPAAGQWVRLEVPASAVGLEGASIQAMCFSTFDGRVTYDKTGKGSAGGTTSAPAPSAPSTTVPAVTVAATDASALIGSASDTAKITFTRTGGTTTPLLVKFALGGSAVKWLDYRRVEGDMPVEVTIPAGSATATLTILGMANITNANPETASFTVSPDTAYTIGAAKTAELTIASSATAPSSGSTAGSGSTTTPTTGDPTTTPSTGGTTTSPSTGGTTTPPSTALAENALFRHPQVGDHGLTILSPTMLELRRITTKQPDPAPVSEWNFISATGAFSAPAASQFAVTVNGQAVAVKSVGFKRRVAYAPLNVRDLRIDNALFLELAATVAEGATVEVKNASGTLWPASLVFKSTAAALRTSPALHVNQEGYVPGFAKKAIVGYSLGNLGEMDVNAGVGFKIVAASTGVAVHQGTLSARRETGYVYSPQPYQKVLEADFTSVTAPGEYQLVVPGLGASLPFLIDEGVAMSFARTYALGLYHQRCGIATTLPYTRFVHDLCHAAPASVPSPQSSFGFTWTTIASKNADAKSDPRHTAPQLKDEASQLYPFVRKGTIDVSKGHHDAGDYSKYTINSAALTHLLTFTSDSVTGAGALDNLGLPESGDGISDILQEAKQEADYIAKLQDTDGGFYFIVYPKDREYENDVAPGQTYPQVVWPKNTSATAASVAALAQIASSPKFKSAYPAESAAYLAKAKLGWQFLTQAIARYGKDGSYQKITFYGQNYLHDDELAWAACELFLATGEAQYHTKLKEWFPNPSDTATFRWGWWRMSESWGNAIRSYAFAARSGRLSAGQLDAAYLAKCEEQIKLAGADALKWSNQSAYGTALPEATRHVLSAGWYFSLDQASDMAIAYLLDPKPEFITALVGNMNYEAGTNPINVSYLTGLGLKRQHEIVHQWSNNSRQTLPMSGIPLGNVQSNFDYLTNYGASGNELAKLSFPTDANGTGMMTPFYDRWADTWNVTTEFVTVNQARSLVSVALLVGQTAAKSTAWKPATTVSIAVPTTVAPVGEPLTLSLNASGLDLNRARIVWEARDQEPDYGTTYTVTPKNPGAQWVEVEITWPDGRRMFGAGSFQANSAVINWVDDAVPTGATTSGSEPWNWITANPTAYAGTKAHQTPAGTGLREHAFNDATAPLTVAAGDTLFAWVYLNPASLPEEIMLHWNDGTWEHRAFWGANNIQYGTLGTASRRSMGALPAAGGWVKLEVPASAVGLEGRDVKGMCFSVFGGSATWDAAGRSSPTP